MNGRSVGVGWGSVDLKSTRGGGGGGVRGSLGPKIVCMGQREGAHGRKAVAFGWGLGCHVYHRRVDCPPQLRGWGYALDRDVRGFHFRWKWKPVRWSWGIGGYGVNSLTNPVDRFWSLGGGDQFGGRGREGSVSGWLTPFRYMLYQIISPTNNF